jgi:hypothetical protein
MAENMTENMAEKRGEQGREKAHTGGGAPTDKAHQDAGDGTLTGAVPAGLGTEKLEEVAKSRKTDDGGTG